MAGEGFIPVLLATVQQLGQGWESAMARGGASEIVRAMPDSAAKS